MTLDQIKSNARRRVALARHVDRLARRLRAELDHDWQTAEGVDVRAAVEMLMDLVDEAPLKAAGEEGGR